VLNDLRARILLEEVSGDQVRRHERDPEA